MNVFELTAKLMADTGEFTKGITGAIGGGVKIIAEGFAAATAAGASAVAALTKSAVQAYANYEQLSGGVETLFKESSDKVMKYADEAYKTSGLSANDYMETVTSFSASLLQSLEGDTDKAADVANQAIIDMSDNANKMGTSIESIQNAYNGFAKGNFTMLDNLKLGYGGTKEEMERLLKDAEKISGVKYNLDSFADITEAIHVMQTELDITGTTAKEASSTIQGSLDSMGAAWQNLVVGIADENQDFGALVDNFVESVGIAADNIIPRIEVALGGVASLIEKVMPIIVEKIPPIIMSVLPQLVQAGIKIVTSLLDGIKQNQSAILKTILDVVGLLGSAFLDNLPMILNLGVEILSTLIEGIAEAIPEIIPALTDAFIEILNVLTQPDMISLLTDATIQLMIAFTEAMVEAIPVIIEALPTIFENIAAAFTENAPLILDAVLLCFTMIGDMFAGLYDTYIAPALASLGTSISNKFSEIVDGAVKFLEDIPNWFESLPEKLVYALGLVIGAITKWIADMYLAVCDIAPVVIDSIVNFFAELPDNIWVWLTSIVSKIKDWFTDMKTKVSEEFPIFMENLINFFKELPTKIVEIGGQIVDGLWEGIQNAWDGFITNVVGLVDSFIQGIKDSLGIASPSKVFKQLGKWTAEGFGNGWDDEFADVKQGILDDMDFSTSDIKLGGVDEESGSGTGNIYQTINVNQQIATPDELAREIRIESRYGLMGGVALG